MFGLLATLNQPDSHSFALLASFDRSKSTSVCQAASFSLRVQSASAVMSFFGFDSALPRDRTHNVQAPGFGSVPDPFAGLSHRKDEDDDDDVLVDHLLLSMSFLLTLPKSQLRGHV